jgi:hypothetical protein
MSRYRIFQTRQFTMVIENHRTFLPAKSNCTRGLQIVPRVQIPRLDLAHRHYVGIDFLLSCPSFVRHDVALLAKALTCSDFAIPASFQPRPFSLLCITQELRE